MITHPMPQPVTVAALIEALQAMPQDALVVADKEGFSYSVKRIVYWPGQRQVEIEL